MRQSRLAPVWGFVLAIPLFFTACGGTSTSQSATQPTSTTGATATTASSSNLTQLCALLPQADVLRITNSQLDSAKAPKLEDSQGFGNIKEQSSCFYYFASSTLSELDYQIAKYDTVDNAKPAFAIYTGDASCTTVSGLGDAACQNGTDGGQVRINVLKGTYTISINRFGSPAATTELMQLLQILLPKLV